jgi:hypothetical protein
MNRLIMKLALALLPPSRRVWGEAMMGEFAGLPKGQNGFALAACRSTQVLIRPTEAINALQRHAVAPSLARRLQL